MWAFRRYVREYFQDQPPSLLGDPAMAREVGELFGIEPESEDTVESYVARVRRKVGVGVRPELGAHAATAYAPGMGESPPDLGP